MKKLFALVLTLLVGLVFVNIPALAADSPSAGVAPQPAKNALVVKCPPLAEPGSKVLVKIVDRLAGQPVAKAEVWGWPLDPAVTAAPAPASNVMEQELLPLGFSDENGEVVAIFRQTGGYLIAAFKPDFAPGFARLLVQGQKALAIRAPESARVLEPIPICVVEKSVLTVEIPVAGASVWALNVLSLPATTAAAPDFAVTAQRLGLFLGKTNEKGWVDPAPVIRQPGDYYLVAVKDGYAPAVSKITIKPFLTATATAKPLPSISSSAALSPSAVNLNKRLAVQSVTAMAVPVPVDAPPLKAEASRIAEAPAR